MPIKQEGNKRKVSCTELFPPHLSSLHTEVESTYLFLEHAVQEDPSLACGAFIDTISQKAGRGQRGNSWYASPGKNIHPSFTVAGTGLSAINGWRIAEWVACALCTLVEELIAAQKEHHTVYIKWPNDIYIGKKKVAGILISHTLAGDLISHSLVGIGLNINEEVFPSSLPNPVSIRQITAMQYDLAAIRTRLKELLASYFPLILDKGSFAELHDHYIQHLYLYHRWHTFRIPSSNQRFRGCIEGVTPEGKLQIRDPHGDAHLFMFKEIEFDETT